MACITGHLFYRKADRLELYVQVKHDGIDVNVFLYLFEMCYLQYCHYLDLLPLLLSRPDMTFTIDWALKANYLSVYPLLENGSIYHLLF